MMMKKSMAFLGILLVLLTLVFSALLFMPKSNDGSAKILIKKGDSISSISQKLAEEDVVYSRAFLVFSSKILNRSQVRPGQYRLPKSVSTWDILQKLAGNPDSFYVRIPEGATLKDMRRILKQVPHLNDTTSKLSAGQLLAKIDANADTERYPEGLFFPDTYEYLPDMDDLDIYKVAYQKMQKQLQDAWEDRQGDLPYQNPYELLIMASIIEKETAHPNDREHVAAVFVNRLRINMRLQTDPTVIYGMGDAYRGKIYRSDLRRDTPYNTYTRAGLPPTPISLPSAAALHAAAHPSSEKYLYFVSKMDNTGESYFSHDLKEHNAAVNKYIRKR